MAVSQTGHSFLPSLCSSKYWSALCYYRLVQTTMNWHVTVNIAIVIHQGNHKVCGPLLSGSFPSRELLIFWNHPFWYMYKFGSVQFISVIQSCLTLLDPMDCSTPGLPVYYQHPELTQTHIHWVGDANQPSHPPLSPSPPTFNLSQHQGLFKWVSSSHKVTKVLELQLQHQSFQWIFRTDFL